MKAFFDMGGYAAYLWPAYAVTFAVVALNVVWARRALRRARTDAWRRLGLRTEDR